MKRNKNLWLALMMVTFFGVETMAQEVSLNEAAHTLRMSAHGTPEFVRFKPDSRIKISEFPAFLQEILEMRPADEYRLIRTEKDNLGWVHYRYQQFHNGFPVEFAIYKAHTHNGEVITMNGDYFPVPENASIGLSEAMALAAAQQALPASTYKWEMPVEEAWLAATTRDPFASYAPQGELVYVKNDGQASSEAWRLAYKFDIYAHEPMARADVYIDAQNGSVVFQDNKIHTGDANGVAVTAYSGTQDIVTDSTGQTYRLRETGRANGVETSTCRTGRALGMRWILWMRTISGTM